MFAKNIIFYNVATEVFQLEPLNIGLASFRIC